MLVTSVIGPVLALDRGYGVGSGQQPAGYMRAAVPRIVYGGGYKPATVLVQGQVLVTGLRRVPDPHYSDRDMEEYGLLGFSLAEETYWVTTVPGRLFYLWQTTSLLLAQTARC